MRPPSSPICLPFENLPRLGGSGFPTIESSTSDSLFGQGSSFGAIEPQQIFQPARQIFRAERIKIDSSSATYLPVRRNIGDSNWTTTRQRFQRRQPESFIDRSIDKSGCTGIERGEQIVLYPAKQTNSFWYRIELEFLE